MGISLHVQPHYKVFNTFSRQSSRLSHSLCLRGYKIFFSTAYTRKRLLQQTAKRMTNFHSASINRRRISYKPKSVGSHSDMAGIYVMIKSAAMLAKRKGVFAFKKSHIDTLSSDDTTKIIEPKGGVNPPIAMFSVMTMPK